jgi:hypothetical protein
MGKALLDHGLTINLGVVTILLKLQPPKKRHCPLIEI